MVDAVEKFPDVTFQRPARACIIPARLSREPFEAANGRMRAFIEAARIRIENEHGFKLRRELPINSMMENPIAHRGFVDDAVFGIKNLELMIRAVAVSSRLQVPVQPKQIVFKVTLKQQNILAPALARPEILPGRKQIFQRNNFLEHMQKISEASVFQKSYDLYKLVHRLVKKYPKNDRYSAGEKTKEKILELIESITKAGYAKKEWKLVQIEQAIISLELVKVFVRLGYDTQCLNEKQCLDLQERIQEIGRELGGWKRSV